MKDEERADHLDDLYENISLILDRLWDNAMDAKQERDHAATPEKKNFMDGVLQGYCEVFETIENQIIINETDREKIGFQYNLTELQ